MPIRLLFRLVLSVFLACVFSSAGQAAELTVSAAASLTDAFREIAAGFEKESPGTKVHLNFGASGALLQQIAKGAPVDVFASADQETMDQAQKQGLIDGRRNFTRNTLVLIQPAGSALKLNSLDDLRQAGIKRITLGNPAVAPIGRYARRALEAANLWEAIAQKLILAQNVRQALDYVARGEVEAGFVFLTDAAIMKDKVGIAFEVPVHQAMVYPVALIRSGPNLTEAKRFIDYVLSPAGQAALARQGFLKP